MRRLIDCSVRHMAPEQAGPEGETVTSDHERAVREEQVVEELLAAAATRLHERIVQPMVDQLTGRFPNAFSAHYRITSALVSECRFAPVRRFPASAKVRIALEWDGTTGRVWLRYAAEVQPPLVPFEGGDRFEIPLTPPGPAKVRHWVQTKLLSFLEVYLEVVEYGPEYRGGNLRADPVCGTPVCPEQPVATPTHGTGAPIGCAPLSAGICSRPTRSCS